MTIKTFRDKTSQQVWEGTHARQLPTNIQGIARRKLRMLHNALSLQDLMAPPANRLEALKGRRKGQHSIRINDQWRICFVWRDNHAEQVEICDYH